MWNLELWTKAKGWAGEKTTNTLKGLDRIISTLSTASWLIDLLEATLIQFSWTYPYWRN